MSIYMIVEVIEVKNAEQYAEYIRRVPETIAKYGGRYLCRSNEADVIEGSWKPRRLVIVEFPSKEKFHAWYKSPEYRVIASLREQSTQTNVIIIEGK